MPYMGHSSYLRKVFDPDELKSIVTKTNNQLKKLEAEGISIDALAFRGQSGAGIAYPLSARFGWKLVCVRKEGIKTHGRHIEATRHNVKTYVIVDDLIASGATMREIFKALPRSKCAAIILYNGKNVKKEFDGVPVIMIRGRRYG